MTPPSTATVCMHSAGACPWSTRGTSCKNDCSQGCAQCGLWPTVPLEGLQYSSKVQGPMLQEPCNAGHRLTTVIDCRSSISSSLT
eukprot:scaffold127536_cov16-Tisochrysis_lutea.AAC.1